MLLAFNYFSRSHQSAYNYPTKQTEQEKAEDSPPPEEKRQVQEAETLVRNYYEDLNRRDVNSAIAKWQKPNIKHLSELIEDIRVVATLKINHLAR